MIFSRPKFAKQFLIVLSLAMLVMPMIPRGAFAQASDNLALTQQEMEYMSQNPRLQVAMLRGVAPLLYVDENDEIQGIGKLVLDEIAAITGLHFELQAFDTVPETLDGEGIDIILGAEAAYSANIPGLVLSEPFLKSHTVLFINKAVNPLDLAGKTRAIVKGNKFTAGIPEELIVPVNNREDALTAVNNGRADYGYGNAYSVAFYTLQNRYKNLITIPLEQEKREYCLGLLHQDDLLLSIINKAIAAIDVEKMQAIILAATTNIDKRLTLTMFLEAYSSLVFIAMLTIIILLALWLRSHLRSRATLQMQNRRYEILAALSNEFLFEYNPITDILTFFQHGRDFFGADCVEVISKTIKESLSTLSSQVRPSAVSEDTSSIVCEKGTFRLVTSNVYTQDGQLETIIGKLVDVSQEIAEKEALITRAQFDGFTGLFNAITMREMIEERLGQKPPNTLDAFLLLDADFFKVVNDTLGHYTGDQVLKRLAKVISSTFRATDIVGRHGGDEFGVYMKNVPSLEFIKNKCQQVINATRITVGDIKISVCVGATTVYSTCSFDEIFKAADDALYQAKAKGPAQALIAHHRAHR